MFRNTHNFSDNRPMGLNNPSRLVEHYFPHSAFDIVQQVHYNLGTLKVLANNLVTFNQLGDRLFDLQGLHKYLGDIVSVANNLSNIITVYDKLPLVQDLAPRLTQFTDELTDVKQSLEHFECTHQEALGQLSSKTKYLEDLYVQYECGLKRILEEQMSAVTIEGNKYKEELSCMVEQVREWHIFLKSKDHLITEYVESQDKLEVRLSHLEASDAVNIWLYTKSGEDYQKAVKAVRNSEKWGNDESSNRIRLAFEEKEDVLAIMKENQDNVIVDKGVCTR